MKNEIDFARNLIKGKIAETIFEQMIREENKFTVIPFGYEHTMPMLAQYQHVFDVQQVIKNISDAPDFALLSEKKDKLFLVEVKYQNELNIKKITEYANHLLERWDFAFIFVVTPHGFFCSMSEWIINEHVINPLSELWVSNERQARFLQLFNEFDKKIL